MQLRLAIHTACIAITIAVVCLGNCCAAADAPKVTAPSAVARTTPNFESASYRITTLPLPESESLEGGGLAFRPDGKLLLATRRGDIWLISNPLATDPKQITWKKFGSGLHEPLGLAVSPSGVYVAQRPELSLLRDTNHDNVADIYETANDRFASTGDYHEFVYGPARDKQGNLFLTLNVGFAKGGPSSALYRGCVVRISPNGTLTPWAFGLRSPNGVNVSPDERLYYTDNQGEWIPVCKLQEVRVGEFFGHRSSLKWKPGYREGDTVPVTPPTIWFPYSLSRSATEPVWDTTGKKFGPFAGQCFVGELTSSRIVRVFLEEVGGRMQGACFNFRDGFQSGVNRLAFAADGSLFVAQTNRGWGSIGGQPHGLQRVAYTGVVPFEIHSMSVTPTGWKLTFTKPVDRQKAADRSTWFLESYTYHLWATYGSPEIERRPNEITEITGSPDGLTVDLHVPQRTTGRVYHLQARALRSADGSDLLHPDGYYTLNNLPK
jgi:glucose/arabinose dehydrogenase